MTKPSSYLYQWKRDGVVIAGATAATYVVGAADVGDTLTCTVTGSNSAGSTVTTSLTTSKVPAVSPTSTTIVYPADAGHVDVTAHGADKTGVTDCTAILQGLIHSGAKGQSGQALTLYFPAGTYLISSTLRAQDSSGNWQSNITYQGENVNTTTIKMKDGVWTSGGFVNSDNTTKVMVYTGSDGDGTPDVGNNAFNNFVFDLTFDLGNNSAGGCLGYLANNVGAIRRVDLKCTAGFLALDIGRGYAGPALVADVNIGTGFANAWITNGQEYSMFLERVKVAETTGAYSGQNQGIAVGIKDCTFAQPILSPEPGGLTVYWDCPDAVTSGPGSTHYYSAGNDGYKIAAVDTPTSAYDPVSDWANVSAYSSVQAAMNSGKSTIYFPAGSNVSIAPTITVPATVNRIICMGDGPSPSSWSLTEPFFETTGTSSTPLTFERGSIQPNGPSGTDQNEYVYVQHSAHRDLVMCDWSGFGTVQMVAGAGRVFYDDVFLRINLVAGSQFFARQLNWEDPTITCVTNNGGQAWIFGMKTEWPNVGSTPYRPTIVGLNGGRTDMMVGFSFPYYGVSTTFAQYQFTNCSWAIDWVNNAFGGGNLDFVTNIDASPAGDTVVTSRGGGYGSFGTSVNSYNGG